MLNIFSFILIFCVLYIFYVKKKVKDIYTSLLVLELLLAFNKMNLGFFCRIGGLSLDYDDFLLGLLFFMSCFFFRKKLSRSALNLILITFIGIFLLYLSPANAETLGFRAKVSWDYYMKVPMAVLERVTFTNQSILMFLRVVIYGVILSTLKFNFSKREIIELAEKVFLYSCAFLLLGVLEIVLKYVLHYDWSNILALIFGRSTSQQGGVIRLQGFTKEPSYYVLALCNFSMLGIALYYRTQYSLAQSARSGNFYKYMILLALCIMAISGSFSNVVVIISVLLLFLCMKSTKNKLKKILFIALPILCLFVTVIVYYFNDATLLWLRNSDVDGIRRMGNSLTVVKAAFSGDYLTAKSFGSESVRLLGTIISFKAFLARPLIGLGIGSVYCLSGIVSILGSVGIIGFSIWYMMIFKKYGGLKRSETLLALLILIPVLFCCDIYTMYDTSYLIIVPVVISVYRMKTGMSEKEGLMNEQRNQ